MKKALVIGSLGYVGSVLVAELKKIQILSLRF